MRRRLGGLLALMLLAGLAAFAQAPAPTQQQQQQAPQQPPVFRGGTTVVPLTVTVVDATGQPVKDLTPSDFTVTLPRAYRPST